MTHEPRPPRFRLEALLRPTSVAVIGTATADGSQVLANLLDGGFSGELMQCEGAPQIAGLARTPDLAIVCSPAEEIPEVFAQLGRIGCFAAIVTGMAGGLSALAARTGVRCLGPGSFGIAIPAMGLNATRSHLKPEAGRVALVSQSAALCRAVLDWAGPNGVGFSQIVGIGGNDDLGFALVLDWLSRDPGTGAILLDIRRIKDRRRFLSAARAAARLRPVMAIRAGGLLMDPSGRADAAFEAALRRCGVLSVNRLEDLLAAAETLTRARPVRGDSLAIVTNAVGPAQLAADAALRHGLRLAVLTPETRLVLRTLAPGVFGERSADNPDLGDIAYVGTGQPLLLAEIAALLAGAREVSGVLVVHAPTGGNDGVAMTAIEAASHGLRVPLLACVMGETTGAGHRRQLARSGVPSFATPEQALRGFLHLVQDRRNRAAARELPDSAVLTLAPDKSAVGHVFAAARAAGRTLLTPTESGRVLGAYGIAALPPLLQMRVAEDATFGPTILFGPPPLAGQDGAFATDLPPLNLTLAHALVNRAHLPLDPPVADAIADALVRISQLVVDFPEIAGIALDQAAEINLRPPGAPPGRLAIPPYPAELSGRYVTGDDVLTVRPIRPEDAAAHAALFARLPPEDIRYRFFSAMRELSNEQIARLTQIDYEREMAFVAVREATGETVGVARLVREGETGAGEFAVLVQPDMKGHGLASHLMHRLIDWARSQGMSEVVGQILADNRTMLEFIRGLGFTLARSPGEPDLIEARLQLEPAGE